MTTVKTDLCPQCKKHQLNGSPDIHVWHYVLGRGKHCPACFEQYIQEKRQEKKK